MHDGRDLESELCDLIVALTLDKPIGSTDLSDRCDELPVHGLAEQQLAARIRDELALAHDASDEREMLEALNGVLLLARVAEPAQRDLSFRETARLLCRSAGSEAAVQCALNLISALADCPARAERAHVIMNLRQSLELLHESTRHFPFDGRHEIAMAGLRAAEQLDCFEIAKQVLDHLLDGLATEEPAATADRLTVIAITLKQMPAAYRTLAATKLYQHVPSRMPWRLQVLEALANNNGCLPDTPSTKEFCKALYQALYTLRIENQ